LSHIKAVESPNAPVREFPANDNSGNNTEPTN